MNDQDTILIKVLSGGKEYHISTYLNEYRSLMALIYDKLYPDSFGECGGMGRCATCQVQLRHEGIDGMRQKESLTLSKHGITDPSIRLSCQLPIDITLHGSVVTLLEQSD